MISNSPQRYSFQVQSTLKQLQENPDDKAAQHMLDWYAEQHATIGILENSTEWRQNNMEYDLRSTEWILEKVRSDETYAQHLYAAICNNDFIKNDVWPLLTELRWSASWRHAGGIIADMQQEGDYIEWYCSGIKPDPLTDHQFNELTDEQQTSYLTSRSFVGEGFVTDEIRADLLKLGWLVVEE